MKAGIPVSQILLLLIFVSAISIMMLIPIKFLFTKGIKFRTKLSTETAGDLVLLSILMDPKGWVISEESFGKLFNARVYHGILDLKKVIADCWYYNSSTNAISCSWGKANYFYISPTGDKVIYPFIVGGKITNVTLNLSEELQEITNDGNGFIARILPYNESIENTGTCFEIFLYDLSLVRYYMINSISPISPEEFIIANFTWLRGTGNVSDLCKIPKYKRTVVIAATDGKGHYLLSLLGVNAYAKE